MKLLVCLIFLIITHLSFAKASEPLENVTIIVWGESGAGISSAVQSIIGQMEVATTNQVGNGTSYLTEYHIPLHPSNSSLQKDLAYLKIVDVDGLNVNVNQPNDHHDASVMSQLLKYLSPLEGSDAKGNLPVFVLVTPFPDNAFYDENSKFSRMLKKVGKFQEILLQRVNSFHTNHISKPLPPSTFIILSKLMNEGSKLIRDRPETKTSLFKGAIQDFVPHFRSLTRNIVVGENKPQLSNLVARNGFTQLPNLELYPRNLLDKIAATANPLKKAMQLFIGMRDVKTANVTKRIIHSSGADALFVSQVAAIDGGVQNSEVSNALIKAYEEEVEKKNLTEIDLLQLQLFLQYKSIMDVSQVPKEEAELAKLLLDMVNYSDVFNADAYHLMKKAFNISFPFSSTSNSQNVSVIVMGKGITGISTTVQTILGPSANMTYGRRKSSSEGEAYVTEYDVSFPDIQSSLKIIDVEGIVEGKPEGHKELVLSSLVSYLSDSEAGLGSGAPNFWIIISNFDDNKFMGPRSTFTKMISAVDKLQNVMGWGTDEGGIANFKNFLLFTKLMSEAGKNQRSPDTKLALFKAAMDSFSGLTLGGGGSVSGNNGLVVGDNRMTQFIQENGYATMPNGEVYPSNVFDMLYRMAGDNPVEQSVIGRFKDVRGSLKPYSVVKSYY